MKIQILGIGCPRCDALESSAVKALELMKLKAEVVKVSDSDEIMNMGVMMTPALAVDGDVLSSGKVLRPEELVALFKSKGLVA